MNVVLGLAMTTFFPRIEFLFLRARFLARSSGVSSSAYSISSSRDSAAASEDLSDDLPSSLSVELPEDFL